MGETLRPRGADLLFALGLLGGALAEIWVTHSAPGPRGVGTVVALVSTLALPWRRDHPLPAVVAATTAILLPLVVPPHQEADGLLVLVAWLVAVHSVNAYVDGARATLASLAVMVSLASVVVDLGSSEGRAPIDVAWATAIVVAAAASGRMLRLVEQRHLAARAVLDEQARAAERRRIATELHDVVAHGLALMVVQAGAAQQLVRSDPAGAEALLDAVQESGAGAAEELRRLLVLVGDPGANRTDPTGDLAGILTLADRVAGTGLSVRVDVDANGAGIAASTQATAYRVVQESLTNALKHGARRLVTIRVGRTEGSLEICVVDHGRADAAPGGAAGHGLAGLRTRISLHGGELLAGPDGDDFVVRASIPTVVDPAPRPAAAGA